MDKDNELAAGQEGEREGGSCENGGGASHGREHSAREGSRGTLIDCISGQEVPATPEEKYATQPFCRKLLDEYGYKPELIQTRPQFRVKTCPSDRRGVPVDIAVHEIINGVKRLKMIVECKEPNIKLTEVECGQLQDYMKWSEAEIGVLYNGVDAEYVAKFARPNGLPEFKRIPAIPRFGEKLEEMGSYRKEHLVPTHNLKAVFEEIRGWIVANGNVTRDETIAEQMIFLMLCKIYDERFTEYDELCCFRALLSDTDADIHARILSLFESTKSKYEDVFDESDSLEFDGKTLRGVVGRLQRYAILQTERDCIADAFEVFIGKSVKEAEGQFFTPRNVISMMVEAVNPGLDDKVIDTACGSGGFLVEALRHIEKLVEEKGRRCRWSEAAKREEIISRAIKNLRGIDKDPFLTKLSKSYMAILGDGKGGIFREDALEIPAKWQAKTQSHIRLGDYDVLLANPPFGKNIKVEGEEKLKQYTLAYKATRGGSGKLVKTGNVSTLFIERNMQMLKDGGKMAIILPEPYFCLPSYADAFAFMMRGNNVLWVIDLPQNTFRPHNNAKCCAVVIQKGVPQGEYINMAVCRHIGHDHQGKPIYDKEGRLKDDSEQIIREIALWNTDPAAMAGQEGALTFRVKAAEVVREQILVPRYYWQSSMRRIREEAEERRIELVSIGKLIEENIITFFDGHGSPPAEMKGLGEVPYIRVKDIVNWSPYIDVTSLVPREVYQKFYRAAKELRPKDILYVTRGSYRIGSVAMISPYDGDMMLTKEITVLRLNEDNPYGISAPYLLYALSHRYVWEQSLDKIFYEPCLPSIGKRWKELLIPVYRDPEEMARVTEQAASVVRHQWKMKEEIRNLRSIGVYQV